MSIVTVNKSSSCDLLGRDLKSSVKEYKCDLATQSPKNVFDISFLGTVQSLDKQSNLLYSSSGYHETHFYH
jgi:hypothetical protein